MFSFVETKLFTRLVQAYLSDDEYAALQASLMANPDIGAVVSRVGSGAEDALAFAGTREAWRVSRDIPAHVLRQISREIENA